MTHGSLFSGIGGFDLAAQWMGWENVLHCEINPFGSQVLKHYWPNAKSYEDITKTDFTIHRGRIDILTGGFPCQPFSLAGKRKGTEDERHLWPEMLRAIREIQPRWIVGENVFGLVNWDGGLVFEQVQADLEAEGYEVQPYILPAAGVNAPHRRDRIWFVAHAKRNDDIRTIAGSYGATQRVEGINRAENSAAGESCRTDIGDDCRHRSIEYVTYTSDTGLQGGENKRITGSGWTEWNEQPAGRVCPNWDEFPTQPPVRGRNDGLPAGLAGITVSKHRNESIKAYGNAIVPQIALQIFKAIQEYETPNLVPGTCR